MKVLAVIPARYASTRLPGKALADLLGKPMLQWVWEKAMAAASIDQVIIATDDERIKNAAESFGAQVVMTSPDCNSGTDRVREVMNKIPADLYVNIQGDEPLIASSDLDRLIEDMAADPKAGAGTLYATISEEEAQDPNLVKVIMSHSCKALYFSRAQIPYPRDEKKAAYLGHIGVYAYRPETLAMFSSLPDSQLEEAEKLEQLRLLQADIPIQCSPAQKMTRGVDTEADLKAVRLLLSGEDLPNPRACNFANISLIITDVDGVLTDGKLFYDQTGEALKGFCARDGLGMIRAKKAGLKIAILSGRDSPALHARIRDMGIELYETGNLAKAEACLDLMRKAGASPEETLFIGDDLPDRIAFSRCAIGVAPADAEAQTRSAADWVTEARGGEGVLREVIERILAARG